MGCWFVQRRLHKSDHEAGVTVYPEGEGRADFFGHDSGIPAWPLGERALQGYKEGGNDA